MAHGHSHPGDPRQPPRGHRAHRQRGRRDTPAVSNDAQWFAVGEWATELPPIPREDTSEVEPPAVLAPDDDARLYRYNAPMVIAIALLALSAVMIIFALV